MNCEVNIMEDSKKEVEFLKGELEKMHSEYTHLRRDNEALRELCIRLAMRLMGVNNG